MQGSLQDRPRLGFLSGLLTRRTKPIDLHGRPPQQVAQIVLHVMTGRDTVEAACKRYRITARQFEAWRENFAEICDQGLQRQGHLHLGPPRQPSAESLEEAFTMTQGQVPSDIASWANARLTSGWRKKTWSMLQNS
jgi:hypothetical protein